MKKIVFVLTLSLALILTACSGSRKETSTASPSADPTIESTAPSTSEAAPQAAFEGEFADVFEALINKAVELEPMEKGTDGKDYPGTLRGLLAEDGYGAANVPVDPEGSESVLGMTAEEMTKLVADSLEQKPNGSWFTHSLVLVRVTSGSDTAAVARQILEGTSPSRFGCLKPGSISVCYAGEYILLAVSSEETVNAAIEAFKALSALEATRLDRENTWSGGMMGGMMGGMIGG